MGARCKSCAHPQRAELDADLAVGVPLRTLARRYGLSKHSISRHKLAGHVPKGVMDLAEQQRELAGIDADRLRAMTGDGVVYAIWRRRMLLDQAVDQAVVAEQPYSVAHLSRVALAHDQALATIVGTIAPRRMEHVHVLASPEWGRIRQAIAEAARRRPDIRPVLLEILRSVEGEAPVLDGLVRRERAAPTLLEAGTGG